MCTADCSICGVVPPLGHTRSAALHAARDENSMVHKYVLVFNYATNKKNINESLRVAFRAVLVLMLCFSLL